jgi:UDP-N-acetylmuramate--alanine ligase
MDSVELSRDLSHFRIHITGIKGTGCAALTEILAARGALITGSDIADVFYTDAILAKLGIRALPFDAKNVAGASLVIYSSAYNPAEHPELIEAERLGIPLVTYPEALGLVSRQSFSVGLAGVHGKTTTAGLTGTLLRALALPAQTLAGSVIASFGDSCVMTNGSRYFVAETCEYKRNFLAFRPSVIALMSVESDHQDFFPAYEDIQNAFLDYIDLLPHGQAASSVRSASGTLIYCADDNGAADTAETAARRRPDIELIPYGEAARGGKFAFAYEGARGGRQFFKIGGFGTSFFLAVPGKHLALNAVCAAAVCYVLSRDSGVSGEEFFSDRTAQKIQAGLSAFTGAKRRSEIIGAVTSGASDTVFIDDYGHHPTAISKTLAGYREFYPGRRLIVDFMPHTFSRTAALFREFSEAFDSADVIILHKIYASAREKDGVAEVTGKALYEEVKKRYAGSVKEVLYFDEPPGALDFCAGLLARGENLFVTMGAGDNWKLGRALFEYMQNDSAERVCGA